MSGRGLGFYSKTCFSIVIFTLVLPETRAKDILSTCSREMKALSEGYRQAVGKADPQSVDDYLDQLERLDADQFAIDRFVALYQTIPGIYFLFANVDILKKATNLAHAEELKLISQVRRNLDATDLQMALQQIRSFNSVFHRLLSQAEAEAFYQAHRIVSSVSGGANMLERLSLQYRRFAQAFPLPQEEDLPDQLHRDLFGIGEAENIRARYFLEKIEHAVRLLEQNMPDSNAGPLLEEYYGIYNLTADQHPSGRKLPRGILTFDNQIEARLAQAGQSLSRLIAGNNPEESEAEIAEIISQMSPMECCLALPKGSDYEGLSLYQSLFITGQTRLLSSLMDAYQQQEHFFYHSPGR